MLRFPELERFGVVAAISDSSDGDCAWNAADAGERARFLGALGLRLDRLQVPRQVHGNAVLPCSAGTPEADGLFATAPGQGVGVTVADCVPLLIYATAPRAVAAVHAGREGTFQNIAAAAVFALGEETGAAPDGLHVVIGPSAGPCCYEVDADMAAAWAARGWAPAGRHLDLWETNRRQLLAAGVPGSHLHLSGVCTICTERFHSLRRTGTKARNLAVIALN